MPKMSESELLSIVTHARDDSLRDQGTWIRESQRALQYYLNHPLGNEEEGRSSVISNDCEQTVDSHLTSLVEVFLGPDEVMEFRPLEGNQADMIEAEQKTSYVNYLVKSQRDSYLILQGWIKDALIQNVSVLKYEYLESEKVTEKEFENLSDEDLVLLMSDFETRPDKYEVIGRDEDEDGHYIRVKCTKTEKKIEYSKIPIENFVISRNAKCKNDAEIVGDMTLISKGDLISSGYDAELVRNLPSKETEEEVETSSMKAIRFKSQGGEDVSEEIRHWTSEMVLVSDLYVLVDFDDDGIVERRRVVIAGNRILDNEPVDHVPYAMLSAHLMPDTLIGQSLVEKTKKTQDIKTALYRQTLDNIYRVNSSRVVVNDQDTNIDDLLVDRPNGIVRTRLPNPNLAVAQLQTPYIGDKALQVIQYVDSRKQETVGGIISNQALESDQLQKESATRFQGVEKASSKKVALVARNFAETGFRELYEGVSWLVSHYYKSKVQYYYKKQALVIDPRFWMHEHYTQSNVGLAASSEERTLENLSGILNTQLMMIEKGAPTSDWKKVYNTTDKIVKTMGMLDTSLYYNDPEVPEELLMAEIERLTRENNEISMMLNQKNQLAEAEMVKQQGTMMRDQANNASKERIKVMELQQDQMQHDDETAIKLTKIEADTNKNVPGSLI